MNAFWSLIIPDFLFMQTAKTKMLEFGIYYFTTHITMKFQFASIYVWRENL